MSFQGGIKFKSFAEFWDYLPEKEAVIADVLRQIVIDTLPSNTKEKLTYNVPFYYLNRRVCLIWPASVPWGGIKSGVLFGFCYGHLLKDVDQYLDKGSNKQVFYKIYQNVEEIDEKSIIKLLKEAMALDKLFVKRK